MKQEEFTAMADGALQDMVLKLKREQLHLRFQRASGLLQNTARVRKIRRDIARIKTVQTARVAQGAARA